MEGLHQDAFNIIGLFLDGRDACRLRCVSRILRQKVDKSSDLTWKRRVHLVFLYNIEDLDRTLSNGPLVSLSDVAGQTWIESILWYEHNKNYYELHNVEPCYFSLVDERYGFFQNSGKGCRGYLQNSESKEIVVANNYYGHHGLFCRAESGWHTCTVADHHAEYFERIDALLPGFISSWKLIQFPRMSQGRHKIAKQDFHCGCCVAVSINPGRLRDVFPIGEYLRRMKAAQPPLRGYTGIGLKRRLVEHTKSTTIPILDRTVPIHVGVRMENTEPIKYKYTEL